MFETSNSTSIILLAAVFVAALIAETVWPLRKSTQPKFTRVKRNLGLALLSLIVVRFALLPLELKAASYVSDQQIGLLNWLNLQGASRLILAILLLDYTLYFWHFLNHKLSFLWRFHNVHHTDLDLDASTASRFHFGELGFSTLYRIAQIFVFGIDVPTLLIFETCITGFAIFHHSNLRLPIKGETFLLKAFVTPRMHGTHHSIIRNETDSNFGTILNCWDRLHRTLKLGIPQEQTIIGVPSYRNFNEQTLPRLLQMPIHRPRRWALPDGTVPARLGPSPE